MPLCSRRMVALIVLALALASQATGAPSITVRNNHDLPYEGPITFRTSLPNGIYRGDKATCVVRDGTARVVAHLRGRSESKLKAVLAMEAVLLSEGRFGAVPRASGIDLAWEKNGIGRMELGLVIVPGREADATQAASAFHPMNLDFERRRDGVLTAVHSSDGYEVRVNITPYGGGWLDVDASVVRTADGPDSVYVALVRRITTPGLDEVRIRWNGRVIAGTDEPKGYDRIFILTRGVDWSSWKSGDVAFAAVNRFTPGFTIQSKSGSWQLANHFYNWERVIREGDSMYLISEIAGPNPQQEKTRYLGVRGYTPPPKGEPVHIGWRLALARSPETGWEDSQLFVHSGYRHVTQSGESAVVNLGAPSVEFGTSYFPYSTMCENFDFYRVAGLDREGWWPFSAKMWENWQAFVPQMQTDLRIIRAMGFDWARLHHLELIGQMDRENALAFLDYYMDTCRDLDLKVLVDTAGSPEWMKLIAGRYKDVVKRVELENEILIRGIRPGDAERWTSCYQAVKKVAPDTQVFLTGACNQGMFDRLVRLGVPFDRVGAHNYKHGPAQKEANCSIALGVAAHATDLDKPAILGEFNWKKLTHCAPEARAKEFAEIYGKMLEPRAIPEFLQFHWQETLSVNPLLTRQGIRHYETIHFDRRPKPEAIEFMKLIRRYSREDSPIRTLPIKIEEATLRNGRAIARYSVENKTNRRLSVKLSTESFQGLQCRLVADASIVLNPGDRATGEIELNLNKDALPGTYHFFLKAGCSDPTAYGWGIVSNPGAPEFGAPLLADLVEYPQGPDVVRKLDYSRPICVAFGTDAPVIELEMAYQAFNTLQSAIGRPIRLCGTADIPKKTMEKGNLILIGTPEKNPLIAQISPELTPGKGTVLLHDAGDGRQWLLLTGNSAEGVRAAATDFVLRYWLNARASAIRVTGMEKGAALGNRASPGQVDLP